ncbi:MAG: hypothetical protein Q7S77_00175 [Candidatus Staskawiczbacteria bacterium]|nr:hypothetical protein [Candidatus Staskawiczbacteria bacterium]
MEAGQQNFSIDTLTKIANALGRKFEVSFIK